MNGPSKKAHLPVMVEEVLEGFEGVNLEIFFDGTLGAAGHAQAILNEHPEIKQYIGCDQDKDALKISKKALSPWKDKVTLIEGNFSDLDQYLRERNISEVDGFFLIWEFLQCN